MNTQYAIRNTRRKRTSEAVTTSQVSQAWMYGAGAMIGLGALFGNRPVFGLGLLLAVALAVAYGWSRWCLENLTVTRRFSQSRAFWGEEVDMGHVFTNEKPLPVPWLGVEDRVPAALELTATRTIPVAQGRVKQISSAVSLGWYERVTRRYTLKCTARGEHEFGPIEISSGDIFGLFRRSETVETVETLLVYPRYVPVARLGIPARQPFGDAKAMQPWATDPLRVRAVREYAYGDNPRHIHWKATARRGTLQTRLFEPAATPKLFIFCNQDTFARIWEGLDLPTLELTITVAASVANHALEEGYMVGLQVNAFSPQSDRQVRLAPSRDPGQFTRVLESLARIKGWSGVSMEGLIRAERRNIPAGATIVLVTGIITDDMLDILLALRRAGHPVTLIETAGSPRGASGPKRASGDALGAQGITYYFVESIGEATELQELVF